MSKSTKVTPVFGPNTLDVRVRERFLASGALDPATLEKHLASLPDLEQSAESLGLSQPAIEGDDEDEE
jgi:hypothetical protein